MSILRNFLRVQLPPEQALQVFRFLQDDTAGISSIDFEWQPARKSSGTFADAAQSRPIGQRPAKSPSTVKTG